MFRKFPRQGGGRVPRPKRTREDPGHDSLYKRALAGDVTACIFYLKNRRPDRWRDVQNITADVGHYIISDRPMTEEQWIAERTALDPKRIVDATQERHSSETPKDTEA